MKAIVVDLELTQVLDREACIIQIGAVLVNTKTQKILDKFDMIVRPDAPEDRVEGLGNIKGRINTNANHERKETITDLTGITAEMVENGTPTREALIQFLNWVDQCACGYRVGEWGGRDTAILQRDFAKYNLKPNKRIKSLDIKRMVEPIREFVDPKAKLKGGLKNTMDLLGLKFDGQQHNAYCDAKATAKLWLYILSVVEKSFYIIRQMNNIQTKIDKEFKDD